MDRKELRGAIRMLESVIEVADEEGHTSVPVVDLRELLETYRKRLVNLKP